jgi:hypothetical protein
VRFDTAERIADAVLYEGCLLYPYRASAKKNHLRWRFGVIAPAAPSDIGDPSYSQTECLIRPGARPSLNVRVRFLHLQSRKLENALGESVSDLVTSHGSVTAWDEGVARTMDIGPIRLNGRGTTRVDVPIGTSGRQDVDLLTDDSGRLEGRVIYTHWPILACLRIEVEHLDAVLRVRLRLENLADWDPEYTRSREAMLRRSLVSAHLLLAVDDGEFVSLLNTPSDLVDAAGACRNIHTWPVLVGGASRSDEMLSSPIVLYDHPELGLGGDADVAGTELEDILSLRTLAAPDTHRRAQDRGRREPQPAVSGDGLIVDGIRVGSGSRVRLRPHRRTDAMDMFLRDQIATVARVYRTVEDRVYVAVTVDADPSADLNKVLERFLYFQPDEVQPLDAAAGTVPAVEPSREPGR